MVFQIENGQTNKCGPLMTLYNAQRIKNNAGNKTSNESNRTKSFSDCIKKHSYQLKSKFKRIKADDKTPTPEGAVGF